MKMICSLFLTSCSITNNKVKIKSSRFFSKVDGAKCIYLELRNDNTFLYQNAYGLSFQPTEGIYIEKNDSIFLYSTIYGNSYYETVLEDCENASFYPHVNDLIFENKLVLKENKNTLLIDNSILKLEKGKQVLKCR